MKKRRKCCGNCIWFTKKKMCGFERPPLPEPMVLAILKDELTRTKLHPFVDGTHCLTFEPKP